MAVPVLALSACGSAVSPQPTRAGGGGDAVLEKTNLVVGVVPVLGVAPLFIAIKKGYFEDEGLVVTPQVLPSGPVSLTAAIGGDVDISFASYIPIFNAQASGAGKLRILAEGSASAPDSFGVYTVPDSSIRQASDLAGKRIGVNAKNNIATVLTNQALGAARVDPSSVSYIEVPFPEMGAALSRGDVDAVFYAEPFITAASAQLGLRRVVDAGVGTVDGLPIDGYAATESWSKQHRNTATAFQRAIQKAAADAANPGETQAVVTDYAKVDPTLAPRMAPLQYPTSLDPARLQRVADLMQAQNIVNATLDVAAFTGIPAA